MLFYKVEGTLTNISTENEDSRRAQRANIRRISLKSSEFNEKYCRDAAYFVSDSSDEIMTIGVIVNQSYKMSEKLKAYLCIRDGEERGFTASEFFQAEREGWEKQYLYKIGKKKEYLPPSKAEGLERVNKYPKSSKYGRQNPISEQWNSEEQLLHWRKMWAHYVNRELEGCELDERIDHRSHKDRGLIEQPTIHEGGIAIAMERKGYISERREINRQIRKDNSILRDIMDAIKYLLKSIFLIFSRIADEMEEVRVNMLALEYDRFEGYPDEKTMQKQVQTYRALEAKAADLDQEKLNEKRMSIRPQKEEIAKTRISDMYGYCQDNFFRASKNAVAKRLGEQPADIEKQEPNKQTVPAPSRLSGRKKKDNREER